MTKSNTVIKIIIIDDHPIVREGIKSSLVNKKNIKIIGEASDGNTAYSLITKIKPDVILLDISIPNLSGIEILRKLAGKLKSKVIIITMHDSKDYIFESIRLGAAGYVLKDSKPKEIVNAIHAVYNNENYYCPQIMKIILNDLTHQIEKKKLKYSESKLTPREKEVLLHIANGLINKEIAKELSVSTRTIETHRERLMKKLDIHNSAGLTKYAIREGILKI